MLKDTMRWAEKQASLERAWEVKGILQLFLQPLLRQLAAKLDHRLVNTFFDLVMIILMHRDRQQGLVMSELGGELLGEEHAPAGAKRISNLLHSKRWGVEPIEATLWQQAKAKVEQWTSSNQEALVIWDDSENEKPESLAAEGLCPARSSKAARLKRIKPGFYNPPGGRPIFVPGFHWLQVVVAGQRGPAWLAHLRWWTTRGPLASDKRSQQFAVLQRVWQTWGRRVVHIFDQGFAGAPWLGWLFLFQLRFVLRWKPGYQLIGPKGQLLSARRLVAWKRSIDYKLIRDAPRRGVRRVGIFFLPVQHPTFPQHRLWLVVSRPGPGRKPWFLLTNEPILSAEDAWRIVFLYARRWQIEMTLRFEKTELAFESPRLHDWQSRRKFLLVAALAHAFLIFLLSPRFQRLTVWLLDHWCHRNGKWSRETPTPLYRLRLALSKLWRAFPPVPHPLLI